MGTGTSWQTLDGAVHMGRDQILQCWEKRVGLFPDFQVQITKWVGGGSMGYAHLTYMGSTGTNKSIDLSFSTPIVLEMEWNEGVLKSGSEYGNPAKMLELEGIMQKPGEEEAMKVSGLGGVFFKTPDPKATAAWYDEHLGTRFGANVWSTFKWRERENRSRIGRTEFSLFKADTDYFAPSASPFMFNFRVYNLEGMLKNLAEKNVTIVGNTEVFEYGKFAWILDPDGNKIELWEPVDAVLEAYDAGS